MTKFEHWLAHPLVHNFYLRKCDGYIRTLHYTHVRYATHT